MVQASQFNHFSIIRAFFVFLTLLFALQGVVVEAVVHRPPMT